MLVKRPAGKLTPQQGKVVRRLAGKVFYEKLAKRIGSSRSNLMRWARDNDISLDARSYKPEIVAQVCAYYEQHGKNATQKRFPKVRVRSIIEKYKLFSPRQIKWTDKELIELARMAGLVSEAAQAKYFNRPFANEGSIRSVWNKRFGFMGGGINGMIHNNSKHLVNGNARYIQTEYGSGDVNHRRICLWVTMEKNLKPGVPKFIADAVTTMAQFQRWLHASEDPAKKIKNMIKRIEQAREN